MAKGRGRKGRGGAAASAAARKGWVTRRSGGRSPERVAARFDRRFKGKGISLAQRYAGVIHRRKPGWNQSTRAVTRTMRAKAVQKAHLFNVTGRRGGLVGGLVHDALRR